MRRFRSCPRFPWLAIGLLLAAGIGCTKDSGGTPADEASKALLAAATPSPASALAPQGEGELARATPSPAAAGATAGAGYDSLSLDANADTESGGAPLTVTFTAEVTGGPPGLHYRWEFGDDTPPVRQLRAQHTYRQPGEYTATFWLTGPPELGVDDSREITIEVTEEGFDFDIETDSDIGTAPLTVEFTARLDEDLPGPFYFQWEFGDGGRDVSNPTTHVYRDPGQYTATVTATNAQGQRATREVEITVDAPDETPLAAGETPPTADEAGQAADETGHEDQ